MPYNLASFLRAKINILTTSGEILISFPSCLVTQMRVYSEVDCDGHRIALGFLGKYYLLGAQITEMKEVVQ